MNGTPERGSPCCRSVSVLLNAGGVNWHDGMVFHIFAIYSTFIRFAVIWVTVFVSSIRFGKSSDAIFDRFRTEKQR